MDTAKHEVYCEPKAATARDILLQNSEGGSHSTSPIGEIHGILPPWGLAAFVVPHGHSDLQLNHGNCPTHRVRDQAPPKRHGERQEISTFAKKKKRSLSR